MVKIFGLTYFYRFFIGLFLQVIVIHRFGLSGVFGMLSDQ